MSAKRKILINPITAAAIGVHKDFCLIENPVTSIMATSFDAVFYSTLFQYGVDAFIIPEKEICKINVDFLQSKSTILDKSWYEYLSFFYSFFANQCGNKIPNETKFFIFFLTDLLYSMKHKTSLIYMHGLFNDILLKIRKELPPELYSLIENIINQFKIEKTSLPFPVLGNNNENIYRFIEIMNSDLFLKYKEESQYLEDSSVNSHEVAMSMNSIGKKLVSKNKKNLKLKKVIIPLLPFTNNLLDVGGSPLQKILLKPFMEIMNNTLNSKKQVLVYDCKDFASKITLDHIKNITKNNDAFSKSIIVDKS